MIIRKSALVLIFGILSQASSAFFVYSTSNIRPPNNNNNIDQQQQQQQRKQQQSTLAIHKSKATTTAKTTALKSAAPQVSSDGGSGGGSGSSSSSSDNDKSNEEHELMMKKNAIYIEGLIDNLSGMLDKYILTGSPPMRERCFRVIEQIASQSKDDELVRKAIRMSRRAGLPMEKTYLEKYTKEFGKTDSEARRKEALARKQWEEQRQQSTNQMGTNVANTALQGKSALSRRTATTTTTSSKPDIFMNNVLNPDDIATIAHDKNELQREMNNNNNSHQQQQFLGDNNNNNNNNGDNSSSSASFAAASAAANRVSELVARQGAGTSFQGESLGIGGLDDVLAQIKRRIWTPLAAPPQLLKELGIHPVRGLLLYGKPGCGKTLLARTLGKILSPMRPITVVSGPEIMDKFVGSSEKNLREIFDNPPAIYETYRVHETDGGMALNSAALHVIVMDEFDAIARTRGGRGSTGDQGDAGVARDSVVNQLLAKMDGVHPLPVPTLVVGLTNKRSLIEPALLRPGRFEVQVEVPPPKSLEQRESILKVHTKEMYKAGRVLVSDAPPNTVASRRCTTNHETNNNNNNNGNDNIIIPTYHELLTEVALRCKDFSGAAIAGVARAAASHALERSVAEFSNAITQDDNDNDSTTSSILDCLVTRDDFMGAVEDVLESMGTSDFSIDDNNKSDTDSDTESPNIEASNNDNNNNNDKAPN